MSILVTGASGFIGGAVCARLVQQGEKVVGTVRRPPARPLAGVDYRTVGDLGGQTDWHKALDEVETIVHCAGRAHVMQETEADPLSAFRAVNVAGTERLARQAATAGIRTFVFLSSVKVQGEGRDRAYCEADPPAPADPYGISKREAEVVLKRIAETTKIELVVIRPPLVYGPGVKANFCSLMQAILRGIPLPLGAIANRRSLVFVENLVDLIVRCIERPEAVNETFLVSDGEDLSTPDLIRRLAHAMKRPARLIPVPVSVLVAALTLLGRRDMGVRLCGDLTVDIGKARRVLDWMPPVSVDEGLRRTAEYYLQYRY